MVEYNYGFSSINLINLLKYLKSCSYPLDCLKKSTKGTTRKAKVGVLGGGIHIYVNRRNLNNNLSLYLSKATIVFDLV